VAQPGGKNLTMNSPLQAADAGSLYKSESAFVLQNVSGQSRLKGARFSAHNNLAARLGFQGLSLGSLGGLIQ